MLKFCEYCFLRQTGTFFLTSMFLHNISFAFLENYHFFAMYILTPEILILTY